jgi:parallel beta-helix repeat protein
MKKISTVLLAIILVCAIFNGLLFLTENASAAVYVSGDITTNTTWKAVNSPYIIVGDVLVDNGTTLTIEPGVSVLFDGKYSIVVNGTLNASGTMSNPILFTSNQSMPNKGDWNRIRLHGKNNTLNYCEISYGHYPLYIMGFDSNNTITNCSVYLSNGDGIYLKKTTDNTIDNVTVSDCYSNGITLLVSEDNLINNSLVEANRAFGIYLRSSRNNTILNTNVSYNGGGGIEFGLITDNIQMRNVIVVGNMDNGIDLNGNGLNNITESIIKGNRGAGIDFGGRSEHQRIENCTINKNYGPGIDLKRASYVKIKNCIISQNKGEAGIYSGKRVDRLNISNSKILSNSKDGIFIYEAEYVNITSSTISNNIMNGIRFNGSDIQENNLIHNCNVSGNGQNGVFFYSYSDVVDSKIQSNNITHNAFYSNGQNGIQLYSQLKLKFRYYYYHAYVRNNFVNNNSIYSNGQDGIYFYSYSHYYDEYAVIQHNEVDNNTIYDNGENGIFLEASTDNRHSTIIAYNKIRDNTIYLNDQNGICFNTNYYGNILYNSISKNEIYQNNLDGIYFTSSSISRHMNFNYNMIFSNNITLNSGDGINFNFDCYYTSYFQYNRIYSNKISSNNYNGISFSIRIYYDNFHFKYNDFYSNTIDSNGQNGIYLLFISFTASISYPYDDFSYMEYNNIYLNEIYSNDYKGIHINGKSRNGYMYFQYNAIYSNRILLHNDVGLSLQIDNVNSSWKYSNIYNNTIHSNLVGINLDNIQSHIININNITSNTWDGIHLASSNFNTIGYNKILYNKKNGIQLSYASKNNRIQNNNFTSNQFYGIYVHSKSNSNTIIRNDILNHPDTGVNISGATDNFLHHNNFKNNTQNAYDSTTQLNDWDDGKEGNWWDDYSGFDSNNDGIGDIPYDVPGGGSKDWYPIIKPANITAPHIENTTPEDDGVDVPVNTKISITFTNKMNKTATEPAITISGSLTAKNFKWSNGDMTVTFELSASLSSETVYTVTVSLAAKDVLDNHLENNYKFSFTSEDIIPPKITSTSPVYYATDIELNATIVVVFNEPMNVTTITHYCSPDPGGWSIEWSQKNTVATYSHNDFGSLITYYFRITGGKDRGGNNLISGSVPNPWYFTTRDVVGPEITTTSPANGSINILVTANVVVTFNEQMNTSSVKYTCKPDPGGWATSWSNGDRILTCSHNSFISQTTYTFHVTAGKDIAGNPLNPSLPNPWVFSTRDTIPPEIIATSPMNNSYSIPLSAHVIVSFNEAMDNTTVTFICNPNPGGWSVSWSGGNTVATYSHNSFTENTNYTFRITGGKDAAGNKLIASTVPNPWVFSTLDNSPPTIIATTPVNGTIDVELDAKIVVTFSEPMNTASVTHTCSPDPGGWVITWGKSSTRATFTHNSFNSTTKYTFQVTSGKDLSGNPMVLGTTPNPWIFTTRDAIGPTIISVSPQNEAVEVVRAANIVL